MTAKDPHVYLEDMRAAIERIQRHIADGKQMFLADEKTQDAVIRQLTIIGEAASKLPRRFTAAHPEPVWKNAIGMRHVLIHDYSRTSIETVWDTVERDLPPLLRTLERLLREKAA
jgi:uncharacterized protein with HEPN domain